MIQSSLSGFFGVLLTLLLILFGLRLAIKYLGPYLLRYALRKLGKKAAERFNNNAQDFSKQNNPGKTTIDTPPPNRRQSNKNAGEYIDYEEID